MSSALMLICVLVALMTPMAVFLLWDRKETKAATATFERTLSPEADAFLAEIEAHADQPLWFESQQIAKEYHDMLQRQAQVLIDKAWGGMPPAQRATGPNNYLDVSPWGGGDKETP
jgi:hypothetical protein